MPMDAKPNKLYVWQPALRDWGAGAIFVIAPDLRTARKLARDGWDDDSTVWHDTAGRPQVYDVAKAEPRRWLMWGSA